MTDKKQIVEHRGHFEKKVTVTDTIHDLNHAASCLSNDHPHKLLFLNAAYAMKQLVDRLYELEGPPPDQVM